MRRMLLAFAIALAAPALAAIRPAVTVVSTSVDEGTAATVRAKRTGDLTRSSGVIFSTSNATAVSGVNYTARSGTLTFAPGQAISSSALVSTRRDGKVTGNLYFIVRLGVVSNATIQANGTVTVRNLDQPPPPAVTWSFCAYEGGICYLSAPANVRYGLDPTWTAPRPVVGFVDCSNATFGDPLVGKVKECRTDGVPASAPPPPQTCPDGSVIAAGATCPVQPPPPPPVGTAWALTGQRPMVGGYVWLPDQGPCCNGLILRVVDHGLTGDSKPTDWWLVQYAADPSGNFPSSSFYWTTNQAYLFGPDLQGVVPSGS